MTIATTDMIPAAPLEAEWFRELQERPGVINVHSDGATVILLTQQEDGSYLLQLGTQRALSAETASVDTIDWTGGQHSFGSGVPLSRVSSMFDLQVKTLTGTAVEPVVEVVL